MKFSTATSDALRVVFELSLRYEEKYIFLEDIERTLSISHKYLKQILDILEKNGIVENYEKRKEELCRLKLSPEDISVSKIIISFEYLSTSDNENNTTYIMEIDSIIKREILEVLEEKIEDIFGHIYFSTLLEKYNKTYSFMLNI